MGENLKIISSLADGEIKTSVEAFLQSLSLNFATKLGKVKYVSHTKANPSIVFLNLDFQDDEDLAASFCTAIMSPKCDDILCSLSQHGLLGFSPTEGSSLADTWHMALMNTIYVCGAEVMGKPQREALSLTSREMIPIWFKVASLVAGTVIENYFSINPALQSLDVDAVEAMVRSKDSAKSIVGEWSQKGAMEILTLVTKDKSAHLSNDERQRAAFLALKNFFLSLNQATRTLKTIIKSGSIDIVHQRVVFKELYAVTVDATAAFTSNEKMIEVYKLWVINHSVSAIGNGVAAIAAFQQTTAYNAARASAALMSSRAADAAKAVPAEGILMQAGRWLSIVKSPPPEVVKQQFTQQAAEFGQKASVFGGKALVSGFLTAITLGFVVRDVVQIVTVKSKLDYSKAVAELIWQTWMCAAEVNTLLRYVHVSGDTFHFEANGGRKWEDFLKQKLRRQPENSWKRPEYVKIYLKDRWIYLDRVKNDLDAKLIALYL